MTQEEVDKFIEESLKMKEFHHRHVMGLHGICLHEPSSPMIIMPFMSNGDLLSYLKSRRQQWEQLDRNTVRNTILSSAVPVACYIAKYNFLLHSPTAACCYEIPLLFPLVLSISFVYTLVAIYVHFVAREAIR